MELFNTWQFNLVMYLIAIVVFFQFNRLAVKQAHDNAAATLILLLIAAVAIVPFVPLESIRFADSWLSYLLIIVASVFYAINDRLQTPIRKNLDVSIFSVTNQLVYVVMIAIGLTVFGESFVPLQILGALLIIAANVLMFSKGRKFKPTRYFWYSVLAAVALAIAISIDVGVSPQFNLPMYIAITLSTPALIIAVTEHVGLGRIKQELARPSTDVKLYLLAGIFWAVMIYFSLRALQLGGIVTVAPLQATAVLLNTLVAYVFLAERSNPIRKLIAAIIVIAGITLISIS